MSDAVFYRAQAQAILEAAERSTDEVQRHRLLTLAARWHQLALAEDAADEAASDPTRK